MTLLERLADWIDRLDVAFFVRHPDLGGVFGIRNRDRRSVFVQGYSPPSSHYEDAIMAQNPVGL
jgi:hypothetical protein